LVTGTRKGADIKFLDINQKAYEDLGMPDGHSFNESSASLPLILGQQLVFKSEVEEKK